MAGLSASSPTPTILFQTQRLPRSAWRPFERAHQARAAALTAAHRERRARGEKHPIEDFLWTYYSVKPTELARWHPGAGIVLADAGVDRAAWRHYTTVAAVSGAGRTDTEFPNAARSTSEACDVTVDLDTYFAKRGATVDFVEQLLAATIEHTPQYGCFGLHEWAMVYRLAPDQVRHARLPLRIGHAATDVVVESHRIACTHFDAYRFFTPDAAPLNTLHPTRETQAATEQAGCLHAGMDVYKWAAKLGPIVPGEVLLDAFVLARDIREVDMRASPYDVTGYAGADGSPLTPIPIETPEGKRTYAELQRGFTIRGNELRKQVLTAIGVARQAFDALTAAR
ncbi:3-methyladenine DNA glycosylase [Leucobacter sp. W1478]|uniref:3-methyladenine DNA glycosylase n=1 Tax=Leucobacter sp. W1478 TaxID=3439065 RepID=UPI003F372BDE